VQLMPKKMNPASYATTGIKTILEIPNYIGRMVTTSPDRTDTNIRRSCTKLRYTHL